MLLRVLVLLSLSWGSVTFTPAALAAEAFGVNSKSAYRDPGTSYLLYKWRNTIFKLAQPNDDQKALKHSRAAMDSAVDYGKPLPHATTWESQAVLNDRFKQIRDYRWMKSPSREDFLRRISWLYPDDGCFARAALAVSNFIHWNMPAPSKVFVFGDLSVHTNNSPTGDVTWWYHVAPIVEVEGEKYVLDPAIDPHAPMTLDKWVSQMTDKTSSLQVAICESGSYDPDDMCDKVSDGVEAQANFDIPYYLSNEWSRLVQLKRNPEAELGENPPW